MLLDAGNVQGVVDCSFVMKGLVHRLEFCQISDRLPCDMRLNMEGHAERSAKHVLHT
jgi:hypothetical protein